MAAGNQWLPRRPPAWTLSTEARGYYRGKYGAGVMYQRLWKNSNYTFNPDVNQDMSEVRVFLSLAIPRWEEQ